jgi:hypothetical protein
MAHYMDNILIHSMVTIFLDRFKRPLCNLNKCPPKVYVLNSDSQPVSLFRSGPFRGEAKGKEVRSLELHPQMGLWDSSLFLFLSFASSAMYSHHDVLPYHWPKCNRPTDH